jgi:hypothetical protein
MNVLKVFLGKTSFSCENREVDATSCLNASEFAGIQAKDTF